MATIFTKIIRGEIPSYKVYEDNDFYAFLDIFPVAKGHTLIVPKQEVDYYFDLDEEKLKKMMIVSKKIAAALKEATHCIKVGIAVIGLEVPHAHLHLVPLNTMEDINFSKPKLKQEPEELQKILAEITKFL